MTETPKDTTQFILIRHGQTPANIANLWHGSTDTPLTDEGHWQADRMGQYVTENYPHCNKVYCSPLERTRHTADALAKRLNQPPVHHQDLQEFGIGELEGEHFNSLKNEHNFFDKLKEDPHFAPAGGESIHSVSHRVTGAFHEIAAKHKGECVAIVSHGAALAIALATLLHNDYYEWNQYQFKNTSISVLSMAPELKLEIYNSVEHLSV
ncbi:MAG: histidine phosphatase family protein [Pseudomonadales bacterium]|nr:histidine phosphatase family protein [Pseudomonadales bacterium]